MVAYAFDLPESKVRVRNPPYLGGGFGVRIGISVNESASPCQDGLLA